MFGFCFLQLLTVLCNTENSNDLLSFWESCKSSRRGLIFRKPMLLLLVYYSERNNRSINNKLDNVMGVGLKVENKAISWAEDEFF